MAESEAVGSSTIAVVRSDWANLPPDVAAMVAPPVTVTASPVGTTPDSWRKGQLARSRANMPAARHRRPAR